MVMKFSKPALQIPIWVLYKRRRRGITASSDHQPGEDCTYGRQGYDGHKKSITTKQASEAFSNIIICNLKVDETIAMAGWDPSFHSSNELESIALTPNFNCSSLYRLPAPLLSSLYIAQAAPGFEKENKKPLKNRKEEKGVD
ncbi:hypothetical protein SAY86_001590 [Trapa natans]|uniref:Uncharacterized protein n=1 Tax=Trapa natans TaxID=22666 RepID=A0AAN7LEL4_TRANT|nr:hypothetical protein SAY86_001590 [Trapa natans]